MISGLSCSRIAGVVVALALPLVRQVQVRCGPEALGLQVWRWKNTGRPRGDIWQKISAIKHIVCEAGLAYTRDWLYIPRYADIQICTQGRKLEPGTSIFSVLGFWDKHTMPYAGTMAFHREPPYLDYRARNNQTQAAWVSPPGMLTLAQPIPPC